MSPSSTPAETTLADRPHTPEPTENNTPKRSVIDTPRRTVVLHYLNDKENHPIKWIADTTKMSTSSVLKIKKEGRARRPSSLQSQAKANAKSTSSGSGKITKTKVSDEKIDKIIETLAVEDPDKEMTWAQIIKRFRLNIGVHQFGRRMHEHGFSREGCTAVWEWVPSPFGGMRRMNPRAKLLALRK